MPSIKASLKPHFKHFKIHQSWLTIFFLTIWSMEYNSLSSSFPVSSSTTLFIWALIAAVGLFISVLIHEIGHIVTERAFGLPIRDRVLFVYGGIITDNNKSNNHNAILSATLSGPIASIITASIWHALYLAAMIGKWPAHLPIICHNLTNINIILTAINILPLPPFDGGIVLYYLLKSPRFKRSPDIITTVSKLTILIIFTFSLFFIFKGFVLSGIWFLFGGMLFKEGLQCSNSGIHLSQIFKEAKVGNYLRLNPVTVQADITLKEFVTQYMYRYHTGIFPVIRHREIQGFILTSSVKVIPKKHWNDCIVSDLTIPCSDTNTISSSTNLLDTIKTMCVHSTSRLIAIDYGEISGVITIKDLLHYLAFRIKPENGKVSIRNIFSTCTISK